MPETISAVGAPRYVHDCTKCVFIGVIAMSDKDMRDAYVCAGREQTSVLRYGSDGPDYTSQPLYMADLLASGIVFPDGQKAICAESLVHKWVLNEAIKRGHISI